VLLHGYIDDLTALCSSAGFRLDANKLPSTVNKISPGSPAAYSGLDEGDTVLQANAEENIVNLNIERKGKRYSIKIAVNPRGLKRQCEASKVPYSFGDSPFDKDLKLLTDSHIVILLDRSLSMNDMHTGCPGDVSKWMWCKQQLDNLFLATQRLQDEDFNLLLFNETYQERKNVRLFELKEIYAQIKPLGLHKNIGRPLEDTLNDYFKRGTGSGKPAVILVLTDGLENIGPSLQDVLIEASRKMRKPGEVHVAFMQIGDSILGEELLNDLEHNLVAKGAKYNMVTFKPFSELRNRGLVHELIDTIRNAKARPSARVQ